MKKKWMTMGAVAGIGAVMLLVSGYSAMASTSGYDAYKSALKNNMSATSIANSGTITVTDNGTNVLEADFLAKINHEQNTMSLALTVGDGAESQAIHVFKQEDQIVFKQDDSDVYRQITLGESNWKHDKAHTSGPPKHVESVIDALMGQMKDLASVQETSDGGKTASLHLSGSQIPAVVNAVGSLAVSNLADCGQWGDVKSETHAAHAQSLTKLTSNIPKLTENVKVRQINLDAEISSDNYLDRQTGEIVVTGTDAAGLEHELVISLDFDLSGFNETTPETIDLTGKQVEVVQQTEANARWHH